MVALARNYGSKFPIDGKVYDWKFMLALAVFRYWVLPFKLDNSKKTLAQQ